MGKPRSDKKGKGEKEKEKKKVATKCRKLHGSM